MKTTFAATCAVALILAGCQGGTEPAAPPTSQDALTTTDAAPTTAMSDDVEATSEAIGDADATTEAGGPPELPDEATEDSESGAAAYATFYLDTLNYSTMTPAKGLLRGLADDDCETCTSFEELVEQYTSENQHSAGPVVTFQPLEARAMGDTMVIFADAVQPVPATLDREGNVVLDGGESTAFTMTIRLKWADESWRITDIQAG